MRGGGHAPPTLTSQDWFYPHHWMYARKQRLQLCVLCGPTHPPAESVLQLTCSKWVKVQSINSSAVFRPLRLSHPARFRTSLGLSLPPVPFRVLPRHYPVVTWGRSLAGSWMKLRSIKDGGNLPFFLTVSRKSRSSDSFIKECSNLPFFLTVSWKSRSSES